LAFYSVEKSRISTDEMTLKNCGCSHCMRQNHQSGCPKRGTNLSTEGKYDTPAEEDACRMRQNIGGRLKGDYLTPAGLQAHLNVDND